MHRSRTILSAIALLALIGAASGEGTARPQAAFGKKMFERYCVACHGLDARGEQPAADGTGVPAADLTGLTLRNGGVFPTDRVAEIVFGGAAVTAHGGPMPSWGLMFLKDYEGFDLQKPGVEQRLVKQRIDDLVAYLKTIQEP
jgi:mono/diheme cytochrome c family protein